MKRILHPVNLAVCALGATACSVQAQLDLSDPSFLKNRISVSARFLFNISAEVRGTGSAIPGAPDYDDGFVQPDISGSADGRTWNWGYAENNQIVGDTLQLHRFQGSPQDGISRSVDDEFSPAFELRYGRELRRWEIGEERYLIVGVDGGFGSMDANMNLGGSATGTATRTTYEFGLGGIVPPSAPYQGTYAGPGPLINGAPGNSFSSPVAVQTTLDSKVRSLVYGFRLGPFVEVPLFKRFALQLGAGLAAVYSDAELEFSQSTTLLDPVTGLGPADRSARYTAGDWMLGYYGTAMISYDFSDALRGFVGGEYQSLDDQTIAGPGLEATLKMKNSFGAVIGLQLLF